MEFLDLGPLRRIGGTVALPGSKSISNRTLLLAALSCETTVIDYLLDSDDTRVMLQALRALGVAWRLESDGTYVVDGVGGAFPVKQADIHLGNAGTAFRPLTAVLALSRGHYRLSGIPRMHERPIGDLVDALRSVGADIRYLGREGYPPLDIRPADISVPRTVRVRGDVSSQFLSALLMAIPLTGQAARIKVLGELISRPYVQITLNQMARFGVDVECDAWQVFRIPQVKAYRSPGRIFVEGDASSASYFLAAGAIGGADGSNPVRVEGVGRASIQGDVRFVEMLERMGARISMGDNWIQAERGPHGLEALDADCNHIPDSAMTLAVVALFARGETSLRNIGSWRVKETDRIAAMAAELRKLGATVEEGSDFLRIRPPVDFRLNSGAAIATYNDHRMAMCFALAALGNVPVRILDPGCVAKTYPEYFRDLARIAV